MPGSRFAPVNVATNGSTGAATSSAGDPTWRRLPSTIAPTRSASVAASSKSCVTTITGRPRLRSSSRSSPRTPALVCASSADKRLVEQQHARLPRERPREGDALTLAAGDLAWPCVGEVTDAKPVEQVANGSPVGRAERDVRADGEMREQRVVLEDEPDRPALRRQVDAAPGVEPRLVVECHAPALGAHEPGDRPQHARLAGARRPDQRERLPPDLERQLESERAERLGEVDVERRHVGTSLTASRSDALATTSSAPIARAVSKSTSNCS